MAKLLFRISAVAVMSLASYADTHAQERLTTRRPSSILTPPPSSSLPCCTCLGEMPTLDLSTGQTSPVDSLWTVNNTSAYTTPPHPSWITGLSSAKWIQPVASPLPGNIPAGISSYRLRFNVPDCTIPMSVSLDGKMAADNKAKVYLDGNVIASCNGPDCFSTSGGQAPVAFNVATVQAGTHLLQVDVTNYASTFGSDTPSGLLVSATLLARCQNCNQCPSIGSFDGANCYVGKPPAGTTAFIWANNFYYTPVAGNQCPQPGSWFDGANCFVLTIPAQTTPFIYANSWYVNSGCRNQKQTDVETPPAK